METDLGLDAIDRRNYELMSSLLKRTCLSAESALTGRPNVETVPLGAKLPMIPGSKLVLHTTNLCETLHLPFCYFDRTFTSDAYIGRAYNCLHDPHLKRFFENRPDITKKLCNENLITSDGKVVCSLKEYNLYRQYLKHLSVQYLNTKYSEQCKKEVAKKNQEIIMKMKEKYRKANSRISEKVGRVKNTRDIMEKETEKKRNDLIRQMQEYTKARESEKKEERLRRMTLVKERERAREQRMKEKASKEYQDMEFRQKLHYIKYQQESQRRQSFEEKIAFERKYKEMLLTENYEKKKIFHDNYISKLKKVVVEAETRRKMRVAEWESFFSKKHQTTLQAIESMKARERQIREQERKLFEERLKKRGWTGAACRAKGLSMFTNGRKQTFGLNGESDRKMSNVARQLSALGFHNATLSTGILRAICLLENDDPSGGDLTFEERRAETRKVSYNTGRKLKATKKDLQLFAKDMVTQIIGISKNVLIPMLESYELKTGVRVSADNIPITLHELSSGVFAEEQDRLPQVLSIHDGNDVTAYAGSKQSNVRFRVSNTELPFDVGNTKHRPPTPKTVRFSSSSSDMEPHFMASESRMLLEETVKKLSEKVVQEIFANTNLVDPEFQREEMNERVNNVAKSIIDEIVMFGLENACSEHSSSKSPSESTELSASLEEKISKLANHLVVDVVPGMTVQKSGSSTTTSSASHISLESNISVLALRVVKSILATVDRKSGKTIGQHLAICDDLEGQVSNFSAKVVEDIAKVRHRLSPDEKESSEFALLEEKISKLALNIITTVHEGKRPTSESSLHSMSCAGVEERVLDLAARIIGGIISLKKTLPSDEKVTGNLKARPANSVERLLREIFSSDDHTAATERTQQKATNADVRRMSYDIARRLVLDRDGGSEIKSSLSDLAAAMAKQTTDKEYAQIQKSLNSEQESSVREDKRSTSSGEMRISSALSEIAELISRNTIEKETSIQSIVSSGASNLASDVADRALVKALMGQSSSKSSAMESGISKLADNAVRNALRDASVLDSNLRKAISSEIKVLAEKIMWQAVEMAVVDPDSLDSSTRSAISTGASTLATQVAGMVSASDSSNSAVSTLQSILSAAVSDMVADMLTERVLLHAREQSVAVEEDRLSREVEKLVRNLLGLKNRESSITATTTSTVTDQSTVRSSDSTASSLALDVVKTFLTRQNSKDRISDDRSSSAISEVASKYVYEVLGMKLNTRRKQCSETTKDSREISKSNQSAAGHGGPTTHPSKTSKTDNNEAGSRKGSLYAKSGQRKSSAYATSFMDWRDSQTGAVFNQVKKKSLNALDGVARYKFDSNSQNATADFLGREKSEEFDIIMDSLAKRIVSSIIANPEIEGETQVDRNMMDSPSVEELVGNMALGVVTSLLGLDVLSNSSPSESDSDSRTTSTQEEDAKSSKANEDEKVVPGPSTGQYDQITAETGKMTDSSVPQSTENSLQEPSPSLLSIFSSGSLTEDGYESSVRSVCEDNAQEHPFRVRSPAGKDVEVTSKVLKTRLEDKSGNIRPKKEAFPKTRRKRNMPEKILPLSHQNNPLKQSSGFLDRRWLTTTKNIEKSSDRLPPIERNNLSPRSSSLLKDKESKSTLRDMFLWQQ